MYHRPQCYAALHWSEDNLLAAAAGGQVSVLSPGDLQGPRSFTAQGIEPLSPGSGSAVPTDHECNADFQVRECAISDRAGAANPVRALAWSPRGLQASGECYLTAITCAGSVGAAPASWHTLTGPTAQQHACLQVTLLARERGCSSEWTPQTDLLQEMVAHLESADWQACAQAGTSAWPSWYCLHLTQVQCRLQSDSLTRWQTRCCASRAAALLARMPPGLLWARVWR